MAGADRHRVGRDVVARARSRNSETGTLTLRLALETGTPGNRDQQSVVGRTDSTFWLPNDRGRKPKRPRRKPSRGR